MNNSKSKDKILCIISTKKRKEAYSTNRKGGHTPQTDTYSTSKIVRDSLLSLRKCARGVAK